ncbi:MAG: hypothetical protein DHS20C19_23200 [Acidimicrobiales bacterium]|nr:MAG: hypothetical protein DHS20C19_23200 [Acidimicrobiales bacterium]
MTDVRQAVTGDIKLGECPIWSEAEQVLYWVDIDGHAVHRYDPATGVDEQRGVGARPGAVALTAEPGRLLLAIEHRITWLDWPSGEVTPWLDVEEPGRNRFNDGRTDPAGRLVIGTMWPDTKARRRTGAVYSIEGDGTVTPLLSEIGVPNGTAFDPERGVMYFADTANQIVVVADYDLETGRRSNAREFLDYRDLAGKPDGACLDADGCYWSASVYGWAVIRVTPDGVVDRRVELPVAKPSMPAFGGADLSTLYVTTIGDAGSAPSEPGRDGFTPGDLLAIDLDVQGRPDPLFPTA